MAALASWKISRYSNIAFAGQRPGDHLDRQSVASHHVDRFEPPVGSTTLPEQLAGPAVDHQLRLQLGDPLLRRIPAQPSPYWSGRPSVPLSIRSWRRQRTSDR
jgi:hypothetical protein